MRRLITTTSLMTTMLFLAFGSVAVAQNTPKGSPGVSPSLLGTIPEAPIGHRQPRADQVPSEKEIADPNNAANKADAALDRKIKSICRGC
jgi:hypothetical protein